MSEIDVITYCVPRPIGDWSPEENLIDTLIKIESKRSWEDYDKTEFQAQIRFTYNDRPIEEAETAEFMEFEL